MKMMNRLFTDPVDHQIWTVDKSDGQVLIFFPILRMQVSALQSQECSS